MELIELDATAQRALELLTNAGMSDGSIYDYTHTGFGSILRHFHTKGILYATAEMLDNFLLEQRVLLDQGDISQWKWGLVRRSCELLKQCAAMNSIDLPDLQPWDPVWNRPKQIIQHDAPTAKQFAESENIYVLVWMVNKRMEQLGLSENTVRHYTEEGLAVILKKHYDSGTESYSDKLISQLTDERRLQYEQGEVGRTTYQDLSVAGARAGLAGARSGLFMEQMRIVREMRAADQKRGRFGVDIRPRWVCWENVPGAFSSGTPKYEDFRIVLEEIVRICFPNELIPSPYPYAWPDAGELTAGGAFSLAWRCLDAQFWGVAQRRKRIFLLADFAGPLAPQLLFDVFGETGNCGKEVT